MRTTFSILTIAMAGLIAYAGSAAADCGNNTQVKGTELRDALSNKVVCVGESNNPNKRWSIWHQGVTGGTMTEWARGQDDAVDPTKDKGTWSLDTPGQGQGINMNWETVTYNYTGGGGSYTYSLHEDTTGSQSLCSNSNELQIWKIVTPSTSINNVCGWPTF